MDRQEMIELVRAEMPEKRWRHTEGVMASAIELALRYGEDPDRAEQAAILHDVAKYWAVDRMESIIREQALDTSVLAYDKELWHAPVGAWVAEHQFGVKDSEVLDAIRFHTSGRRGMGKLEKIVWLADYIEPGRDFPGVAEVRKLAESSLEHAIIAALDGTIGFLIAKGRRIYPMTIDARNGLLEERQNK